MKQEDLTEETHRTFSFVVFVFLLNKNYIKFMRKFITVLVSYISCTMF
jgi:hypothetical protein